MSQASYSKPTEKVVSPNHVRKNACQIHANSVLADLLTLLRMELRRWTKRLREPSAIPERTSWAGTSVLSAYFVERRLSPRILQHALGKLAAATTPLTQIASAARADLRRKIRHAKRGFWRRIPVRSTASRGPRISQSDGDGAGRWLMVINGGCDHLAV